MTQALRGPDFYIPADIRSKIETERVAMRASGIQKIVRNAAESFAGSPLHAVTWNSGQTELLTDAELPA